MEDYLEILRCPTTGKPLHRMADGALAADGGPHYPVADGVVGLLPLSDTEADPSHNIREFYQSDGWQTDADGVFKDTKAFLDTRSVAQDFNNKCIARLNKYFRSGGKYLLDAGSGPIPHDALLSYGDRFERRVCVDLSIQGLRAAQRKLGDRGVYLQGDLTRLPLKDESMDAVTCNHVLYQVPADRQETALMEMWRVLKPGGVAVIVYAWPYAPLARRIEKAVRLFVRGGAKPQDAILELYHHPHPPAWFKHKRWPFKARIESFRIVGQGFLRDYVSDDWRGRAFLDAIYAAQVLAPGFCGHYGEIPTIIVRKT